MYFFICCWTPTCLRWISVTVNKFTMQTAFGAVDCNLNSAFSFPDPCYLHSNLWLREGGTRANGSEKICYCWFQLPLNTNRSLLPLSGDNSINYQPQTCLNALYLFNVQRELKSSVLLGVRIRSVVYASPVHLNDLWTNMCALVSRHGTCFWDCRAMHVQWSVKSVRRAKRTYYVEKVLRMWARFHIAQNVRIW